MSGRTMSFAPLVLAVVGLGLLAYETVQALRKVVIGTTGDILLYVGVGLVVAAAVLVVVDLTSADETHNEVAPAVTPTAVTAPEPQGPTDT
jgi:uncharacterized membrane protein